MTNHEPIPEELYPCVRIYEQALSEISDISTSKIPEGDTDMYFDAWISIFHSDKHKEATRSLTGHGVFILNTLYRLKEKAEVWGSLDSLLEDVREEWKNIEPRLSESYSERN